MGIYLRGLGSTELDPPAIHLSRVSQGQGFSGHRCSREWLWVCGGCSQISGAWLGGRRVWNVPGELGSREQGLENCEPRHLPLQGQPGPSSPMGSHGQRCHGGMVTRRWFLFGLQLSIICHFLVARSSDSKIRQILSPPQNSPETRSSQTVPLYLEINKMFCAF